ncbi:MAG: sigma-70 family RNA polymerase sigma factor [bacterium]|nr:sigma-70 family RNA polymerase sigma factor [Myxococcales bacterium]MCB9540852.1 sigma-70 family RNA polymerase sigma factor [Myxococcales bacterium]
MTTATRTRRNPREKMSLTEERELVSRAKDGDREALDELISAHYQAMYHLALKYTRDPHRAQEATQESCVQVLRHMEQFRSEARFGSWMARIVINSARLRHRRERRLVPVGDAMAFDQPCKSPTPDRTVADRQLLALVDNFLRDGRDGDYQLFIQRYVDQDSVRRVARESGISMPAVKTRVHRARQKLRDHADASNWQPSFGV